MYKQTIQQIDREQALKLLDKNTMNRYLNHKTIDRYADQMSKDEWKVNGSNIIIADDGTLLDGQHRLHAIVKADAQVSMAVFEGVTLDAIKTMDTGKPRTLADHLKIHGFTPVNKVDMKIIAACIRILFDFEDGSYHPRKLKITPTDAIKFLEDHKALFDSAAFASDIRKQISIPPSVFVSMHYLYAKKDREKADNFFQRLATGANLPEESPILALRNKLMFMDGEVKTISVTKRRVYISYLTQALKASFSDKKLTHEGLQYKHTAEITLHD